jgi:hypothetical protein
MSATTWREKSTTSGRAARPDERRDGPRRHPEVVSTYARGGYRTTFEEPVVREIDGNGREVFAPGSREPVPWTRTWRSTTEW